MHYINTVYNFCEQTNGWKHTNRQTEQTNGWMDGNKQMDGLNKRTKQTNGQSKQTDGWTETKKLMDGTNGRETTNGRNKQKRKVGAYVVYWKV